MGTTAPPLVDESAARRRMAGVEARAIRARLAPPPKLTLTEWADAHRRLSSEASAEPGQWRTSRAPYLAELQDTISGTEYQRVVFIKSSQVGGTECLNNAVGYFIDQLPSPILLVQPTLDMAKAWSKDRLAPMLRDTPRLQGKVKDPRSRDSGNTTLHKSFPGGHLTMLGANSPSGLASRPIRVVLADELDRWPHSAGTEGDPLGLATKRTTTFWNRKIVIVSTPGNKGASRIEKEWERSDQRRFHLPCPDCGRPQTLRWENLRWDKEEHEGEKRHKPETAYYVCEGCGSAIEEHQKPRMLAGGRWVAANPESRVAGFHINALYSPWARWSELVEEWLAAQGDVELLRVFINTVLGETFEDQSEKVTPGDLQERCEAYPAEVPAGVAVLTASVDVQADRLEVAVKGYGEGQQSWLITHQRLYGDPDLPDVWARLESLLSKGYEHESGATLHIRAAAIDSGYKTEKVYEFVRPREGRNVWAIKGNDTRARDLLTRPQKKNKFRVKPITIATYSFKDIVFSRLRRQNPGPGYMHFPQPREGVEGVDANYFQQFAGEVVIETRNQRGVPQRVYKRVGRNEAIDLEVYALAALYALGPTVYDNLGTLGAQVRQEGEKRRAAAASETAAQPTAQPPRPARRTSGFVNSWKKW